MIDPRLYIFDADGTLRWTTVPGQKYPLAPSQWRLMPGVQEVLARIPFNAELGPWMAIASNQNGVAEGLLTEKAARSLIRDMLVEAIGPYADHVGVALCTCSESISCRCRKPAPGLLLDLLEHFKVQAADAIFVGDLEIDKEAARQADVGFVWARDFFSS